MRKLLSIITAMTIIVSGFSLFTSVDFADVSASDVKTLEYTVERDIPLQGVFSDYSFFVESNEHWKYKGKAQLYLKFSHSNTGIGYGSSLNVFINDVPVQSIFLTKEKRTLEEKIIEFDTGILNDTFNKVQIKTYHRLTDDMCNDDLNPANWVTIHKGTQLKVDYENKIDTDKIYHYPYPYIDPIRFENQFVFLIDRNPTPTTIQAMMILSAGLGKATVENGLDARIMYTDEFEMLDQSNSVDTHFIYIGESMPPYFSSKLKMEPARLENLGCIFEVTMENKKGLFVLSKNSQGLLDAVSALGNSDIVNQMNSSLVYIDKNYDYEVSPENANRAFTLKSLGYSSHESYGSKSSVVDYFIDLPNDLTIEKGSNFLLKMRYSDLVVSDKSSVTIKVNDIPVGSEILLNDSGQMDIKFDLPSEVLNKKSLIITIQSYIDTSENCEDGSENPGYWLYISNESTLQIDTTTKQTHSLTDFPAPFVKDKRVNNINFTLPIDYTLEDIENTLEAAALIGGYAQSYSDMSVTFGFLDTTKNNITVVQAKSSLMREINSDLLVPLDENFECFVDSEYTELLPIFSKNTSAIQLLNNLENQSSLVVTSTGSGDVKWALKALRTNRDGRLPDSSLMFIDGRGTIEFGMMDTQDDVEEIEPANPPADEVTSLPSESLMIQVFIIIVIILLLIIVSLHKWRLSRK